jgi:hypothetical protein
MSAVEPGRRDVQANEEPAHPYPFLIQETRTRQDFLRFFATSLVSSKQ